MPRASFGGAQDISLVLSGFFQQYQDRLEDLALRAERRSKEEQAAADQDAYNRWQAGEMSDEEWLAYVRERIEASKNEPEELTYWRDQLRDSEASITQERIADQAEDIMARIDAGTATYQDLLRLYSRELARLDPDSPLAEELRDEIDRTKGVIRDQATGGNIARAEFLFRSGQISGAQAATMIRKEAERYKNSDPQKYYQLLSSAYDLETFGSNGSRGSGSGGGGGTSDFSKGDLTDIGYQFDALHYRIDSLSDQFENGSSVGRDSNGDLIPLMNEDGTPSDQMQAIDQQNLEAFDAEYEVFTEIANDPNVDERVRIDALKRAEQAANNRTSYIVDHIQPRNTIAYENQFNGMVNSLDNIMEIAGNSPDPQRYVKSLRRQVSNLKYWHSQLNSRAAEQNVGGFDEAADPDTRIALQPEDQIAPEFIQNVEGFLGTIEEALAPGADPVALGRLLEGVDDQRLGRLAGQAGALVAAAEGLDNGTAVRVFTEGGVEIVPLKPQARVVTGPNGEQQTIQELAPDLSGVIQNEGQQMVRVFHEQNGQIVAGWAVGTRTVDSQGNVSMRVRVGNRTFLGSYTTDPSSGEPVLAGFTDAITGQTVAAPFAGNARAVQEYVNQNPNVLQRISVENGVTGATQPFFDPVQDRERRRLTQAARGSRGGFQEFGDPENTDPIQGLQQMAQSMGIRGGLFGGLVPGARASTATGAARSAGGSFESTIRPPIGRQGPGRKLPLQSLDSEPTFRLPAIEPSRSGHLQFSDLNIRRPNIRPVRVNVPNLDLDLGRAAPGSFSGVRVRRPTTGRSGFREEFA